MLKKETKIQRHIKKECKGIVVEYLNYLKYMDCEHKWKKHIGYGYDCVKCGYYTWVDLRLDILIEEFLTTKDK